MALLGSAAQAEDLYEVYKAAVQSDPLIREAEARRLAALEAKPQARGLLLPQIAVGGDTYMANADTEGYQRQFREIVDPVTGESSVGTVSVPFTNTTDTDAYWSYDAQLTQTVFRWDQWQRLKQADSQVALAEANYRVGAAGPHGARRAALLRRAGRRRHAVRRRGHARGRQSPARAGREALRGRADRHHRRAGSPRGARQRDRRRDRGQARARHARTSSCGSSPARPTRSW